MDTRLGDWMREDKGIILKGDQKKGQRKAKIVSIPFLIFLDFSLGKTWSPWGQGSLSCLYLDRRKQV